MKTVGLKARLEGALANAPADNELKNELAKKLQPNLSSGERHKMLLSSLQETINTKGVVEYEGQPDLLVHDLLFLRQRLNVGAATMGCTESRINWTVNTPMFDASTLPPNVGQELGAIFAAGGPKPDTPSLHGREDSSCFERLVCPLFRSFELKLLEDDEDGGGLIIERPMVCEPCQCWPLCFTQSQRVLVKDLDGRLLGQAIEPSPVFCGYHTSARNAAALAGSGPLCCTRVYVAQDAKGEALYTLKAHMSRDNMCAPSCCNESFDVEMYDWATGAYVGMSAFVWPGCNLGGDTDRSRLILRMPAKATPTARAAVLAAMLLIEYSAIENNRQLDCSNGTGALGAPPRAEEMQR